MTLRHAIASLVCAAVAVDASMAAAQDDAPAAPASAAPVEAQDPAWQRDFAKARDKLVAGSFRDAAESFARLAATAPGPVERALALENARLAETWLAQGVVLGQRGAALGPPGPSERTLDELAVLYTNAVFYGLGTGVWLDVLTEPDSPAGAILPALGLAGAAVAGVAIADGRSHLPYGVPQSIVSGMYIGLEEGITLSFWNQARVEHRDEWTAKAVASVVWGFTTAGAVAGGVIGAIGGSTPGRASFVGSAGLWTATFAGFAASALTPDSKEQYRDDNALLAAVIGLNVGAVGGAVAAGPVSPSIARVRFLDLGGIGGSLLAGGLYFAAADKHPDVAGASGAIALGTGIGVAAAWALTAGMEPDRGRPTKSAWWNRIEPVVGYRDSGATLGIAGTF
jgi:hypothetical protein